MSSKRFPLRMILVHLIVQVPHSTDGETRKRRRSSSSSNVNKCLPSIVLSRDAWLPELHLKIKTDVRNCFVMSRSLWLETGSQITRVLMSNLSLLNTSFQASHASWSSRPNTGHMWDFLSSPPNARHCIILRAPYVSREPPMLPCPHSRRSRMGRLTGSE